MRRLAVNKPVAADALPALERDANGLRTLAESRPPLMALLPADGAHWLNVSADEQGAMGCRVLVDTRSPLLLPLHAEKHDHRKLSNSGPVPSPDDTTCGNIESDIHHTMALNELLQSERDGVEKE